MNSHSYQQSTKELTTPRSMDHPRCSIDPSPMRTVVALIKMRRKDLERSLFVWNVQILEVPSMNS